MVKRRGPCQHADEAHLVIGNRIFGIAAPAVWQEFS
jgi:hypothetical protein